MSNIKAVILDKDGVFVNFHQLWLRVIAYRAQLIAETSTGTWDHFNCVRTACIRAMGIDEDMETIDAYAPCSMPADDVKLALQVATYLTVNAWNPAFAFKQARDVVEEACTLAREQLNVVELSEQIPGSAEKIKEISDAGIKVAVFSSDSVENINGTLEKFKVKTKIVGVQGGERKTTELYLEFCESLGLSPEETLMVSDVPHDLDIARAAGARTVAVLSGVVSKENIGLMKVVADEILDSLADLNVSKLGGNKKKAKT